MAPAFLSSTPPRPTHTQTDTLKQSVRGCLCLWWKLSITFSFPLSMEPLTITSSLLVTSAKNLFLTLAAPDGLQMCPLWKLLRLHYIDMMLSFQAWPSPQIPGWHFKPCFKHFEKGNASLRLQSCSVDRSYRLFTLMAHLFWSGD